MAEAISNITQEEFNRFCPEIFRGINIDVLIHGNWLIDEAKSIFHIVADAFNGQYQHKNKCHIPVLDIQGVGTIKYPLVLPEHDYAAVTYYPLPDRELKTIALCMITSQILSPIFFQQMRTEKQYGYLVGVGFVPINRFPGIAFYIQSPNVESNTLSEAIDEFINECQSYLTDLDDENWHHLLAGLASQLQEKDTSLRIKSQRFWSAICNEEFGFNQKAQLVEVLKTLSRADLMTFIAQYLYSDSKDFDRFTLITEKETISQNSQIEDFLKKCSTK